MTNNSTLCPLNCSCAFAHFFVWFYSFRTRCFGYGLFGLCAFVLLISHTLSLVLMEANKAEGNITNKVRNTHRHTHTHTHTLRGIYRSPKNIHVKCAFSISPICLYSLLSLITPQYCSGNSAHVVRVTLLHHTDNFLQRKFD